MYLDRYGLPVQANGDALDQLNRVGLIAVGIVLGGDVKALRGAPVTHAEFALRMLQVDDGIYQRHVDGDPRNVSADQLIAALAYWVAADKWPQIWFMLRQCLLRLGFAQNYKDGLNADTRSKVPDFMLLRAAPLFARISWLTYPLALACDGYLVAAAIGSAFSRNPDDVDDNCLLLTLAVCNSRRPTPLSALACYLYGKLRPYNLGVAQLGSENNVQGALDWYHRAGAGGNPQIALLWRPIIQRMFTR